MADRPTVPSSLDTKPAAVELAPAPVNGQMVSAARLEVVTYGQQPQQPQPASAGGFPFLPLMGIAAAIAVTTLGIAAAMPQIFSSKISELKAQQMTLERQLEAAKNDSQKLDQRKETLCYVNP